MNTEHETPIQTILRENEARKASQNSNENIKIIAKRLFNLEQIKNKLGLVSKNNIPAYQSKIKRQSANKFQQTKNKINNLTALIRKSNAVLAGA